MKRCTKCQNDKPFARFFWRKQRNAWRSWCKDCVKQASRRWYQENPEKARRIYCDAARRRSERLRHQVFAHYSSGEPKCACCKETGFRFLTLDHTNNNGGEHRREVGDGLSTHIWLVRNGFPNGFQVLCWNCQMGKVFNGGICPHQEAINKAAA